MFCCCYVPLVYARGEGESGRASVLLFSGSVHAHAYVGPSFRVGHFYNKVIVLSSCEFCLYSGAGYSIIIYVFITLSAQFIQFNYSDQLRIPEELSRDH